jgi:hypothetical protein
MVKFPPDDADYRVIVGKMRRLTEEMYQGDSNTLSKKPGNDGAQLKSNKPQTTLSNLIESSYASGELPSADNIPQL